MKKEANWLVTSVWKFAMDGISILLIFLCVSSWVMWYKIRTDYKWSAIVLTIGFLSSFYFVYLIALL